MPSNRFITPESQGGAFKGQFELQYTSAQELYLTTYTGRIDQGVTYVKIPRTGYMFATSIFDRLDIIWSHVGAGNSLGGGKFQLLGDPRTAKAAGHKLSVSALMGGNEHETRDKSIKFRLDASELLLAYGYRFNENVMPYLSLGQSSYKFAAVLSMPYPEIDGAEPMLTTTIRSYNLGGDFSFGSLFAKAELSYQQIETSDTKAITATSFGASAGVQW